MKGRPVAGRAASLRARAFPIGRTGGLIPGYDFVFEPVFARAASLFMCSYFAMTGVHALHMIIGIGLMTFLLILAVRVRITPLHHEHMDIIRLYWHFVDIIWIFLYPLLYLIDRHK
jgi:cytochrome c oxidase subunit III